MPRAAPRDPHALGPLWLEYEWAPQPMWGARRLPYREVREGIDVLRLPLVVGRSTAAQRVRQEASYALALTAAIPFLPRADVVVAISPSFPALLPAVVYARTRRVPLIVVLKDLLPDGAVATGLMSPDSRIVARLVERAGCGWGGRQLSTGIIPRGGGQRAGAAPGARAPRG